MARPSLLLIDFLNDDPFNQYRDRAYPFLRGWCGQRGVRVEWLDVPAGRASRPNHAYVVERLAADDLAAVLAHVRRMRPGVLVANEKVGAELESALRSAGAGDVVCGVETGWLCEALLPWLPDLGSSLDAGIEELAPPDYSCEFVGSGPTATVHLQAILAGPSCVWRRPLATNRHFAGVDLGGGGAVGCSFCANGGESTTTLRADAVELALLQVRRFLETAPAHRRPPQFDLIGALVFARLGEFLEGLLTLGAGPCDVYLTCRVDEVQRARGALETWVPKLNESGIVLHVWNIGAENFSADENERFNKGISVSQIEAAVALLDDLAARFPKALRWRQHGGFGLIPFTPWTRLDDLETNLAALRRLELVDEMAPLLSTRLQLRAGTGLVALARHDGVLLEDWQAPSCIPSCMSCLETWDERELPWRFREPIVGEVYRALSALFPLGSATPARGDVTSERGDLPWRGQRPANAADALDLLLAAARTHPDADADGLMAAASARAPGAGRSTLAGLLGHVLLQRSPKAPAWPGGWQIDEVVSTDATGVRALVRFRQGERRLDVVVEPDADPRSPAFARGGGFRLFHRAETPLSSPADGRTIEAVGHLLEKVVRARGAAKIAAGTKQKA